MFFVGSALHIPRTIFLFSGVLLTLFLVSQPVSAQNAIVRDTLPTEARPDDDSLKTLRTTISDEDLQYYGLEEKTRRALSASVLLSGIYDSNIFIANRNEVDDFIWTVSPQITYEPNHIQTNTPHYFKALYNPAFHFFTDNPSENSVEHSGLASYLYKGQVLTFNAKHQSGTQSGATRDIGNRTRRDTHRTQISAHAAINDQWSLLSNTHQDLAFYDRQNNQHTWSTEGFLLYRPHRTLLLGVGPKIGWTDISGGPNQDFQQALAKLSSSPHPDWQIDLTGGVEFRSFQDGDGVGTRATPVYTADLSYRLFPRTKTLLSGYRRVAASSGIDAANYTATGGRIGIQQNIARGWDYAGFFGVEFTDYYNTSTITRTVDREDLFFYHTHELSYRYNAHLSMALSYQWMFNDSERSHFESNRVGLSATLTY